MSNNNNRNKKETKRKRTENNVRRAERKYICSGRFASWVTFFRPLFSDSIVRELSERQEMMCICAPVCMLNLDAFFAHLSSTISSLILSTNTLPLIRPKLKSVRRESDSNRKLKHKNQHGRWGEEYKWFGVCLCTHAEAKGKRRYNRSIKEKEMGKERKFSVEIQQEMLMMLCRRRDMLRLESSGEKRERFRCIFLPRLESEYGLLLKLALFRLVCGSSFLEDEKKPDDDRLNRVFR